MKSESAIEQWDYRWMKSTLEKQMDYNERGKEAAAKKHERMISSFAGYWSALRLEKTRVLAENFQQCATKKN
jgi:hypothetical protein